MAEIIGITVKAGTWIGSISLDASLSEVHSMSGEATSHPVETGSNISDHFHTNPRTVQIQGFITNHPVIVPGSQAVGVREVEKEFQWEAMPDIPIIQVGGPGVLGMVSGAIATAVGANIHTSTAKGFEPAFDRVQDVLQELKEIFKEGRVIDIVTTLQIYYNMILESIEINRDVNSVNTLLFNATAKEIAIVETSLVPAPPVPKVERGKEEKQRAKKPATPASEAASQAGTEVGESFLYGVIG